MGQNFFKYWKKIIESVNTFINADYIKWVTTSWTHSTQKKIRKQK